MKTKLLTGLIIYYGIMSLFLLLASDTIFADEGEYNININITGDFNLTDINSEEIDTNSMSIGRFLGLITMGIGFPDDFPVWFKNIYAIFQTLISMLTVAMIYEAIRRG